MIKDKLFFYSNRRKLEFGKVKGVHIVDTDNLIYDGYNNDFGPLVLGQMHDYFKNLNVHL